MATAVVPTVTPVDTESRSDAARRYPPLVFLVVAVILALAVLPSALTLPQSNPTQTVEIAPVPPDDDIPPQQGNLASLELGSSESVEGGGALGGNDAQVPEELAPDELPPPPEATPPGQGKPKTALKCAQTSQGLRQTEDITSPPCVAYFEGDNGGATYQGVTAKEIKIVIYAEGGIFSTPTARGTDNFPSNVLVDLDAPPQANETGDVITLRAWFKYFNDRYQLYGRRAHGWIYYSGGGTQQQRQADAAQAYSLVKPFATISTAGYDGSGDAYIKYMAQRGVINFGSQQGRPGEFFRQFPKLMWGYPPSLEQQAKLYADYICTKVANKPADGAGGALANKPRKYGLIYTSDANYPNLAAAKDEAVKLLRERCNITFEDEATYPNNGFAIDPVTDPSYAQQAMARFAQKGITTVLWPGGIEVNFSPSAARTVPAYQPEWFLMGDGQNDSAGYAVVQDQSTWSRAWVVTPQTKFQDLETEVCYQQYRSVDQQAQDSDVQNYACSYYNDLRQMFSGIQVAGPRLGPTSIDRGFHAIPAVESTDPRVAACYYEPGDYTCVKDAQAMWYDPNGQVGSQQQPGCWRMVDGGQRHIFGKWPPEPPNADKSPDDECNEYDTSQNVNNDPENTS
ncbi:MAG TPA: hypothetical protein VF230_01965 [Acidimicrobiales bacterium]